MKKTPRHIDSKCQSLVTVKRATSWTERDAERGISVFRFYCKQPASSFYELAHRKQTLWHSTFFFLSCARIRVCTQYKLLHHVTGHEILVYTVLMHEFYIYGRWSVNIHLRDRRHCCSITAR